MKTGHWILENNQLKSVSLLTWAKWFENRKSPGRITAQDTIGNVSVSTVFPGIDHNFDEGEPLLWETMIFGSEKEELKDYYKSVLNNGEMSLKGGGGLGMIDIARKTGEKLEYNFLEIDNKVSFFTLNIKINQIQL